MKRLTDEQVIEYFHRCYKAVDGLWFLKVEDAYGFEVALDIDKEVWRVMPKIQARMLKSMLKVENNLQGLLECLSAKLTLEGFDFHIEEFDEGFRAIINKCPWHEIMLKSGREKFSGKVGDVICGIEYEVWAMEFGEDISFKRGSMICAHDDVCVLEFKTQSQ